MNVFSDVCKFPCGEVERVCTSKHRVWSPKHRLLGGAPPNTPFERMEVFLWKDCFLSIGFLLGGVCGVLVMCLLQINRRYHEEDKE